ncbi:uncharacterized protein LOC102803115 [Saccoglossus kowalevskii]
MDLRDLTGFASLDPPTADVGYQASDAIVFQFDINVNFTQSVKTTALSFFETTNSFKIKITLLSWTYAELIGDVWLDTTAPSTITEITSGLWENKINLADQATDCRIYGELSTVILENDICNENCGAFSNDGNCDDGGPNAVSTSCDYGDDCTDCGVRNSVAPGQELTMSIKISYRPTIMSPLSTLAQYDSDPVKIQMIHFDFSPPVVTVSGAPNSSFVAIGNRAVFDFSVSLPMASLQPWYIEMLSPSIDGRVTLTIADINLISIGANVPCPPDNLINDVTVCSNVADFITYHSTGPGMEINRALINFTEYMFISAGAVSDIENTLVFEVKIRLEDHPSMENGSKYWFQVGGFIENSLILTSQVPFYALLNEDRQPNLICNTSVINENGVYYRGDNVSAQIILHHQTDSDAYAHDVTISVISTPYVKYSDCTWNNETIETGPSLISQNGYITHIKFDSVTFIEQVELQLTFNIDPDELQNGGVYIFIGVVDILYKSTRTSTNTLSMGGGFIQVTYQVPDCTSSQLQHGTSCYSQSGTGVAWQQAVSQCSTEGGSLVIINDAAENSFIFNNYVTDPNKEFWIGSNDLITEDIFQWHDETYLSYSNWAAGEPSDGYHCAVIGGSYSDKWGTRSCLDAVDYICETRGEQAPTVSYTLNAVDPVEDYNARQFLDDVNGQWSITCDDIVPRQGGSACSRLNVDGRMSAITPGAVNVIGWNSSEYYGISHNTNAYLISNDDGNSWYSIRKELWDTASADVDMVVYSVVPTANHDNSAVIMNGTKTAIWQCSTC